MEKSRHSPADGNSASLAPRPPTATAAYFPRADATTGSPHGGTSTSKWYAFCSIRHPKIPSAWPGQSSTYGAGYAEPIQRYTSYSSAPPYETGLSSLLQGWPTQQQESSNYNPYAPAGGQATTTSLPQTSEFDMYAPASGPQVTKQPAESVRREFDRKSSGTPAVAHANERSGYDETTRLYEESPARGGYEPSRRDSWPRRSDPGPYSRRKPRREVYDESRRSERYHGGDDHDRGRVYR